jgi:hypothetical protein
MTRTRRPASGSRSTGGWKHGRVDGVGDQVRLHELDTQRPMRLEAVARLHDRRVGESRVELGDARVCAVVEAAVRSDRAVDTMDEAHVGARETTEAPEVEVERVDEARRRPGRDRR